VARALRAPPPSWGFTSGWESAAGLVAAAPHSTAGGWAEASRGPQCRETAEQEPQPGFTCGQPTSAGTARGAGGTASRLWAASWRRGVGLQHLVSNVKRIFLAVSCRTPLEQQRLFQRALRLPRRSFSNPQNLRSAASEILLTSLILSNPGV